MSKILPLSDEKETQSLKAMVLKAREARVLDGRPSRIYDIGHEGRGSDNGAVGYLGKSYDEVDICIPIALEQLKSDIANGVNVYFTCEDPSGKEVFNSNYTSKSLFPWTRADIANQIIGNNPDSDFIFVSLHANSGYTDGVSGTGVEVIHSSYAGSKELAERIAENAKDNGNLPLRGNDGAFTLSERPRAKGVLSSVNCPAVLYEAGFLSNSADIGKMLKMNFPEQVAKNLNSPLYDDINSGKVFAGYKKLNEDSEYRAEFLARIDSGAASKKDIVRFQTIMGIEADGDFGKISEYARAVVAFNGDVFTESAKESAIYFQNNPSARDSALAQLAFDMELKQQHETLLAKKESSSDLGRESLAAMVEDMPKPTAADFAVDSKEESSLAFVDIEDMDFGNTWSDTQPKVDSNALMATNLTNKTNNGTIEIPVSASSDKFAETMEKFYAQLNFHAQAEVSKAVPVESSNTNPFDIDKTTAKANTIPAQPEPEAMQPAPAQAEAKEKIAEMFAQFNGEKGNVAMVYQRSTTLSPQDKAAATLVQQSLNLIGIAEIPDNELGHVAGGKTKQEVMEFQKLDGLKVDGIVGANTYSKLEEKVLKAIDDNPAKAQEFVLALQKSQERYLAELVADSKNAIAQNSAIELPTPQNQAGQDVGRA